MTTSDTPRGHTPSRGTTSVHNPTETNPTNSNPTDSNPGRGTPLGNTPSGDPPDSDTPSRTTGHGGLTLIDVTVRYGALTAVDRVTLTVEPGEIVAVLGPSGSGKSSLLRAVAGLEPLTDGTVAWAGADLIHVPVHRRGFVVMFQDGQLFPHLTVAGNVAYGLAHLPRAERRRRVEELLDLVDLADYGPRSITTLSGGQAQRVALARSLAPRPRLLLLDEPLSALDRGLRDHLVHVLGDTLRATGTPALYVTHDQAEGFALADRVGVMVAGRLLQVAPAATLQHAPASPAVAEFLGLSPAP